MLQACQLGPKNDVAQVHLCSQDNNCETDNPPDVRRQQTENDTTNAAHTALEDSNAVPSGEKNNGSSFLSTLFAMLEAS
jgi:hypothetical protein